ncbi:hypothetical protein [Methylomonas sp. DH-1]|uniref:hypothetical protein n=1 Tax=Methylomonas sp. (strain DH-1) TaxID=1727196 RepID=UPI0007C8F8AA|nr:hypothetical protein [Methylomonas sp. DH-1]ANE56527.1 hypothetical protein AYM39_15990 [Methylomonas sp. DH-1]
MFNNGNNNARNDKFARLKAIAAGESEPAAASSFPEIWKHEVDKPLIGTFLGYGNFEHERFGLQETAIVQTENGQRVSAILNNYLSNGMQYQQAEPGDLVLIRLLGKEKSTNGSVYNKFELVVQKEQ